MIVLTGLGAFRPQVRAALTAGAVNYLAQVHYIRLGDRQDAVVGRLTRVLEEVAERGGYRRIHLLGYSFGSVVAIDALFPPERRPTPRFSRIDTLVTIGCPFDLLRSPWPDYFNKRATLPSTAGPVAQRPRSERRTLIRLRRRDTWEVESQKTP